MIPVRFKEEIGTGSIRTANAVIVIFCLFFLLITSACASKRPKNSGTEAEPDCKSSSDLKYVDSDLLKGQASWYGKKFHGRKTANGEIYDMYAMTGAHRKIKLGTFVRVTNLENNKRIVVKINDRGPYAKGRVLDLSFAAADKLGYRSKGVTEVVIDSCTDTARITPASTTEKVGPEIGLPIGPASVNHVQAGDNDQSGDVLRLGTFESHWKAERLYYYLRGRFSTIRIKESGAEYRVYIGPFKSEKIRRRIFKQLSNEGFDVMFN